MHKVFYVLLSFAFMLSANAVGNTQNTKTSDERSKLSKKCVFPKSRKRAPNWICATSSENSSLTAIGSHAKSAAGIAFMEQMAVADARAHLAQSVSKTKQENIGVDPSTATPDKNNNEHSRTINESLQDTRVLKRAYGPDGSLYVLVGFKERCAR